MFRFLEIFTICFDICNGMLIGWLLCERYEQAQKVPDGDVTFETPENLFSNYPRIKAPKQLILLFYVFAVLFFAALSFYLAITTVTCS